MRNSSCPWTRTLEKVAQSSDATPRERHDALFYQARILADDLGLIEPAIQVHQHFLAEFPEGASSDAARRRLAALEASRKQ